MVFQEWYLALSPLRRAQLCTGPSPIKVRVFRLSTVGIILMIAGAFGFVVSAIIFAVSRGPERTQRHSLDRQVVDTSGNTSSVHEDSK